MIQIYPAFVERVGNIDILLFATIIKREHLLSGFWAELVSLHTYAIENIECLLYSVELIAVNFSFFWAFFDLLVDISESFGILAAASVVMASYTTTLFIIHNASSYVSSKTVSLSNSKSSKLLNLYNNFKDRL